VTTPPEPPPAPDPRGGDPARDRLALLALAAVAAAVFLTALDQTMVVTVLPSILRDLRIPFTRLDQAAWIVTGYLLGYTVAMPLFGRIADVRGRRIMVVVSLGIFMAGSVLCLMARNLEVLVAARIIQAAGGGALVPIAMAVAGDLFPAKRVAVALGVIGAAAEGGGVLGPLYGAVLSQLFGWRSIFLVNLPLGLLLGGLSWGVLGAAYRGRRADGGIEKEGSRLGGRIDFLGAVLLGAALSLLTIGLSGNGQGAGPPAKLPWLLAGGVAFALFLFRERRTEYPLVRLDLFRRPPFTAANLANLAVGGALIVGMVEIPLLAYSLLGWSEIGGGLLLMRLTVMIPIGALLGGWVADRVGYRITGIAGFVLIAVGYVLIARWPVVPREPALTLDLAVTGLGFGLVIAPIGATVVTSLRERWLATGSALVTVMRMIGMTVGLAALSSWGLRRFNGLMAETSLPLRLPGMSQAQADALTRAYNDAVHAALHTVYREFFLVAAGIALLAILPTLWFPRKAPGGPRPPFLPQ
jgi:EmrB/QacA subfamily drug resistance transporter